MSDHNYLDQDDLYLKVGISKKGIRKWYMPVLGFLALVWFLIRVVPKPSRFRYPCQRRLAAPMAIGFLSWGAGLIGITTAIKKLRQFYQHRNFSFISIILVLILLAGSFSLLYNNSSANIKSNQPLGKGQGINPGRVVWSHNSSATSWDGEAQYWWDQENTNYEIVQTMLNKSLQKLTGTDSVSSSWKALFEDIDQKYSRKTIGYEPGKAIAIKLNLNTENFYSEKSNEIDTSPQVIEALVTSLVESGVREKDIILFDASRVVCDKLYNPVHEKYSEVRFVDSEGGPGRTQAEPDSASPLQFKEQDIRSFYLPQSVTGAKYLINLANLKKHSLAGVTLTAKNHFGSIYDTSYDSWTPRALHSGISTSNNNPGQPNPLVNIIGHKDLGGKTVLYLIDALYGGMNQQSVEPVPWEMSPFNGDYTSSLFLSQDPVAIDSVAFDFLRTETDIPAGSNNYLKEAAQAGDPPSGISYIPEENGSQLKSLGVNESWNNARDKQYSRNLGKNKGIELIKIK